ncbi:terpene cyclase [Epichloe festucae Fl1]|uniref:Bifunctional lycopene cyclase/phytoene synthase n=1 Tax=Epichloe festucae (strain Fl1) TaxID=877507 RepID=A0A7S9PTF6_EPIFF|nr:terpene cyclase [Epichloe festucae Fl1]
MGFDYALVHVKYTIPPAVILTFFYRGISTRLDLYRVAFLVSIAVIATIPWDSYLIHQEIWTYPPHVIVGPKLFDIPAEELFFFVIQAYNTSILYLFLSKTVTHAAYLLPAQRCKSNDDGGTHEAALKHGIFALMATVISLGAWMMAHGGQGTTYLGLILVWAGPFALLLWGLSGYMIQRLPLSTTLLPIVLPTLYLWVVDTIALRRGTWVIASGTKLGIHVWRGLEVEEAIFFLATNTLIVFGLVAFDHAVAILDANASTFPRIAATPSPALLIRALVLSSAQYDHGRIHAIRDAVERLRRKSRSFHFASAFFSGRTRIDLVLLYSFCRVADDLVDNAKTSKEAFEHVAKLREYLDAVFDAGDDGKERMSNAPVVLKRGVTSFPEDARSALLHLPTYLPSAPLYRLLDGFETDLRFNNDLGTAWPIQDEAHVSEYAACVAGTVAELCIELILHNTTTPIPRSMHGHLVTSGRRMGIALQYVNMARDISVDAAMNRVYLPTTWLTQQKLSPDDVLANPTSAAVLGLRERLLDEADGIYRDNRGAIDALPSEVRGPMRVAVESYMEIGRVLRRGGGGERERESVV